MGSSEALIRATVNRISARLGHGVADAAAELAVLAQDAPPVSYTHLTLPTN